MDVSRGLVSVASLLSFTMLTSCSNLVSPRCAEGSDISRRALLDLAASKIVRRSLASSDPQEIRYASLEEFYGTNPSCCHLSRADRFKDDRFKLPLEQDIELAILYRAFRATETPYRLRHVTVGACPSHQEESDTRLSVRQYEDRRLQSLGEPIT